MYFGTSLACGAFAYDAIAVRNGEEADELAGHMPVALVVASAIAVVTLLAYTAFLGFDVASETGVVFWGGVVVCGILVNLGAALVRLLVRNAPAFVVDVIGLVGAFLGGVSIRVLMWICATGYLNLFAHTVPSVMMNL